MGGTTLYDLGIFVGRLRKPTCCLKYAYTMRVEQENTVYEAAILRKIECLWGLYWQRKGIDDQQRGLLTNDLLGCV
jgi:hypothetical protein